MTGSNKAVTVTRIIACAVFKQALNYLRLKERYPKLLVTYYPARLHLQPFKLRKRLQRDITKAGETGERIICLYGECFADINDFCTVQGIIKVPGLNCYEMFLGRERFKQLVDEITGTYFLEESLIVNFEDYCMKPLELGDEEIRRQCFEHYKRLLYIRQPSDPELISNVSEIARFLKLSLAIEDADYTHLEKEITRFL